ncbi:succinate--CoA ligase [GDP-forming] subunit beta, mitochondrial [Sipha flava]|uniref:Succinate--CoA ligase [GDP-forming] subunit beta, mitochondrial n=1 Tax=Sipha flava TaxID=143950 RepID=A0A2S2QVC8_9HEMI|nr:succinate--CoA ligase [GDP-forming] subunit beta, mitochondrial [Sipha flava]XP_025419523.1 succinate--CoA ligase [GDP-forming] subunit beta, mitochondrial [Sipha flava]
MSRFMKHVIKNKFPKTFIQLKNIQARQLNLLECHSKDLLSQHGVTVQKFKIIENADETNNLLKTFNVDEYVLKAQVLAGGRGKGHFSNGFKGGVHVTKERSKIHDLLKNMLGFKLITKQTPKDGILVNKVMVAESVNIKRETYFCILMDRNENGPVLIASPAGGMDIEDVAVNSPELIKKIPIDIYEGISDEVALDVAKFLNFDGPLANMAANEIKRLWDFFLSVDAVQIEINPLVETTDNKVVCVDAKIQFDDNSQFRHQQVFELDDTSESDPREVMANKHNLNYIGMDGNIGCLVNGAGLAMATMDIIKLRGGEPANFLDVGGNVNENQVYEAFKLLTLDSSVKAILVNVFGGIVNCATISKGLINASKKLNLKIPLVVRLEGTNVSAGKKLLEESGLLIQFASDLDEAARKVISSVEK